MNECLECGGGITSHGIGCHTGSGLFQIVLDGAITDYAYIEAGLYRSLADTVNKRQGLKGVKVYRDGVKLSREQLKDLAVTAIKAVK